VPTPVLSSSGTVDSLYPTHSPQKDEGGGCARVAPTPIHFTPLWLLGAALEDADTVLGNGATIPMDGGAPLGNGGVPLENGGAIPGGGGVPPGNDGAIPGSGQTISGNDGMIPTNGGAIPTLCSARGASTLCAPIYARTPAFPNAKRAPLNRERRSSPLTKGHAERSSQSSQEVKNLPKFVWPARDDSCANVSNFMLLT